MKPFFTVIIPTYNRAQTIERAINSVLDQDYDNFELIIIDDGSTDNTKVILKDYEGHSKVQVFFQDNQGVSAARNFGINKSRGDWIAFLDSDDEWLPKKLSIQTEYIISHPQYNLVHGDEIWIRNGVRVNQMNKHKKGGGDQFIRSLKLCLISPSCVTLKKSLLEKHDNFREDYPCCEDYDLWLKITALEEIGFIETPLIKKYGGHEDQLSSKFVAMDYWRVKSIDYVLKNFSLQEEKSDKAKSVLLKKAKLLLRGYEKHGNMGDFEEVKSIYQFYR